MFNVLESRVWKDYCFVIFLVALCGLVMLMPAGVRDILRYHRELVSDWQVWRLVTANLVHSNAWHWLFNSLGLILIWRLFYDSFSVLRWCVILLGLFVTNILLIHYFTPSIRFYVGMSGALHGMLVLALIARNHLPIAVNILVLAGVIGKVIWENWFQTESSMSALIETRVAVEAHLYGVICGFVGGVLIRGCQFMKTRTNSKTSSLIKNHHDST